LRSQTYDVELLKQQKSIDDRNRKLNQPFLSFKRNETVSYAEPTYKDISNFA
jgi:hypothetical protein